MKYFFCTLILALAFTSKAQSFNEKIVSTPLSNACFGAIGVSDDLFFSLTNADEYFGNNQSCMVYHTDANLNIIDSIDLTTHNGAVEFNINNLVKASDSTFWVIGNVLYTQPNASAAHAVLFDVNLNIIDELIHYTPLDSTAWWLSIEKVDSFTVVGGYQFDQGFHPGYWIFDNKGDLFFSNVLDTVSRGAITGLQYVNESLLFGLTFMPFHSRGEINLNDFTINKIIKDDRASNGGSLFINGFIDVGVSSNDIWGYGQLAVQTLALVKMDSNLNQVAIDTFSTTPGKWTKVDRGMLDASAHNKLYFVTAEDAKFTASDLQPGLMNNMKLWRVDTGGNVIWSVLVNDSSYYFPTKTVATSDGGAVFFSMKYDWRKDVAPKTDLSIIKLDSNGNFVGLHEMELPYQKPLAVSVYPNPAVDEISLAGVELRDLAAILVYTIDGILVKEVVNPQSLTISMEDVSAGTYVIHTLYKNGRQGMGKVIKGK
ncbi:T9SS type A sorting domain-containing protein [Owenweeksia hongkongensis]|uniref:T9SS type A sorting domain-containing protein n=1 Tax=Owenweeksia hongkongensis TaxID=253245 RepID=UPI003A8E0338